MREFAIIATPSHKTLLSYLHEGSTLTALRCNVQIRGQSRADEVVPLIQGSRKTYGCRMSSVMPLDNSVILFFRISRSLQLVQRRFPMAQKRPQENHGYTIQNQKRSENLCKLCNQDSFDFIRLPESKVNICIPCSEFVSDELKSHLKGGK